MGHISIEEIQEEIFDESTTEPVFVSVANEPSGHCLDAFAQQGEYGLYNSTTFLALSMADSSIHWIK